MPTRPGKPCRIPSCPRINCQVHKVRPWTGGRADSGRKYSSVSPKIRARVLREEPNCMTCGAPSTVVDHIVARAFGGPEEARSNLQGLCTSCSKRKAAREGVAGRHRGAR